jgi:hypothetical protein
VYVLIPPIFLPTSSHPRAGQGRAGQGRVGQGRTGQGRAGQESFSPLLIVAGSIRGMRAATKATNGHEAVQWICKARNRKKND